MRWPLLLPPALAAGAAVYMAASHEPGWELLAVAAAIPALLWFIARRRGAGLLALVLASLACVGIGAIAGKVRSGLVAAPILKEQIGPLRLEGIIVVIDASERSRRVRLAVRAIEGLPPDKTTRYVRFSFKGELGFGPAAPLPVAPFCHHRHGQSCLATTRFIVMLGLNACHHTADNARRMRCSSRRAVRPQRSFPRAYGPEPGCCDRDRLLFGSFLARRGMPRLGAAGVALAALAIALFCVLDRRGRIFALIMQQQRWLSGFRRPRLLATLPMMGRCSSSDQTGGSS